MQIADCSSRSLSSTDQDRRPRPLSLLRRAQADAHHLRHAQVPRARAGADRPRPGTPTSMTRTDYLPQEGGGARSPHAAAEWPARCVCLRRRRGTTRRSTCGVSGYYRSSCSSVTTPSRERPTRRARHAVRTVPRVTLPPQMCSFHSFTGDAQRDPTRDVGVPRGLQRVGPREGLPRRAAAARRQGAQPWGHNNSMAKPCAVVGIVAVVLYTCRGGVYFVRGEMTTSTRHRRG